MPTENLHKAKQNKNDEFYTRYEDIEKEVLKYIDYNKDVFRDKTILLPCDDPEWSNFTIFFAQHFEEFRIKKLISTSYAIESKKQQYSLLDFLSDTDIVTNSNHYDSMINSTRGKIFTLERGDKKVDFKNLQWEYLKGDGDFRSEEVKKLRTEADIIITNPPFSLFREFIQWLFEEDKQFIILGHMNAITYKEVFQKIKDNKMWLGVTNFNEGMYFYVPKKFVYSDRYNFLKELDGKKVNRVPGVCWFTNLQHGRRHNPLILNTTEENLRFNTNVKKIGYLKYENYDAIEVPTINAIPSDCDEVMGVPITFLNSYCPEQFEIVALGIIGSCEFINNRKMIILDKNGKETTKTTWNAKGTLYRKHSKFDTSPPAFKDCETGELYQSIYARILIKKVNSTTHD